MKPRNFSLAQAIILLGVIFVLSSLPKEIFAQENLKIVYTSPYQSSQWNKCETNIILKTNRTISADELKTLSLSVTGRDKLPIEGVIIQTAKANTIIFQPNVPFTAGERVEVSLTFLQNKSGELIY